MDNDKKQDYTELSNVEKQENYLTEQEYPEGPYGSPFRKDDPVQNKSTPWKEGQRYYSAFTSENKALHQETPRQMDGAHLPHDNPDTDEELNINGKSGGA